MFQRVKPTLFAVFVILPGIASAGMITDEGLEPYEICALCHSLDGNSRMSKFPKLAGQPAAYIEKQISDFLAGRRDNDGGQMVAIVTAELAPENIPIVAEWFATQAPPPPVEAGDVTAGETAFADLGCKTCHDEADPATETPHLTSQHQAYLVKQMEDFRDGRRGNDADGAMQAAMQNVSDADIEAIATYLSATPRGFDGNS
ncbi:MAG: c-type cytochrome [Pseudomonadota bacterium]